MNINERTRLIEDAIQMIEQAEQMVNEAISETGLESHYEAYGKYGFNQLLSNGNPYDNGLDYLIEELNM